jgi:hypothetical protein
MKAETNPLTRGAIAAFCSSGRLWRTLCLAGSFAPFAGLAADCVTPQPKPETQDILLGSGFRVVKAVTPAQRAHRKTLPGGRVTIVMREGRTWYVFPDAAHNRIYVGNSNQYQSFLLTYQDEQLTNGETGEANLAKDSAEWDAWNALGVWGGPD